MIAAKEKMHCHLQDCLVLLEFLRHLLEHTFCILEFFPEFWNSEIGKKSGFFARIPEKNPDFCPVFSRFFRCGEAARSNERKVEEGRQQGCQRREGCAKRTGASRPRQGSARRSYTPHKAGLR